MFTNKLKFYEALNGFNKHIKHIHQQVIEDAVQLKQKSMENHNIINFNQAVDILVQDIFTDEAARVAAINELYKIHNKKIKELIEEYHNGALQAAQDSFSHDVPYSIAHHCFYALQKLNAGIDEYVATLYFSIKQIDEQERYVYNNQYAENFILFGTIIKSSATSKLTAKQLANKFKRKVIDSYKAKQFLDAEAKKTNINIRRLEAETQRLLEDAQRLNRELIELTVMYNKDNVEQDKYRINVIKFDLDSIRKLQDECDAQRQELLTQYDQYIKQIQQMQQRIDERKSQVIGVVQTPYPSSLLLQHEACTNTAYAIQQKAADTAGVLTMNLDCLDKVALQAKSFNSMLGMFIKNHKLLYWSIFSGLGVFVGFMLKAIILKFAPNLVFDLSTKTVIGIYGCGLVIGLLSMVTIGARIYHMIMCTNVKRIYSVGLDNLTKIKDELNLSINNFNSIIIDPELSALIVQMNADFKEQFDLIEAQIKSTNPKTIPDGQAELFKTNLISELAYLEEMHDIKIKLVQQLQNMHTSYQLCQPQMEL